MQSSTQRRAADAGGWSAAWAFLCPIPAAGLGLGTDTMGRRKELDSYHIRQNKATGIRTDRHLN